jgi:hypothetical protein
MREIVWTRGAEADLETVADILLQGLSKAFSGALLS